MRNLFRIIASPVLALILLLAFAASMAIATFVENDFGTATAWKIIYDSWWFEVIMIGLGLSFIANIFRYRLYKRSKWSILLFHLAFIVILLGAGITRYTATGGVMRIREGNASSTIISNENYLKFHLSSGEAHQAYSTEIAFSPLSDNEFHWKGEFNGKPVAIVLDSFVPDASLQILDDQPDGEPLLELVVTEGEGRQNLILKQGEVEIIGKDSLKVGFETYGDKLISIYEEEGEFKIGSPEPLNFFVMSRQEGGVLTTDSIQPFELRTLFRWNDVAFVPLAYHQKGKISFESSSEKPGDNDAAKDDILRFRVISGESEQTLSVLYRDGHIPTSHSVEINGVSIDISYGAEAIPLPFALYLEDFELVRYPGSTSPSSYASDVVIVENDNREPFRIFMNHVLDHEGYRFYQASYDTDERGTVLSVNKDRPGTYVTYCGYMLMGLGMFFTLFGRNSRYSQINRKLKNLKKKHTDMAVGLILLATWVLPAQNTAQEIPPVEPQLATYFGRLLVQDLDGRIKPVNTLSSEFLRKISRKTYYKKEEIKLSSDQVFLSMMLFPNYWREQPVLKIDPELLNNIELPNAFDSDKVAFNDLLAENGDYLLSVAVENANRKNPAQRNETDKEVLKVDERFNIFFNLISGNYLKIFPNRNDDQDTWYSYNYDFHDFPREDGNFAKNIIPALYDDINRGAWADAYEKVGYISTYQKVLAENIIPGEERVNAELWYNEMNVNFWMFQILFTLGFSILLLAVYRIFHNPKWVRILWNLSVILILISFIVFTGNLILRWYVSGHAPWSNGYEMLVFVGWVLLLCGLIVFRKSDFALPLATLFSGTLMFVSYLDWINPEITNLMPVLKSYWLKVHVATIVSSYAPLALSAILGLMVMILLLIRTSVSSEAIDTRIKELTYINEISMTIGLFVLAVGTFLGGVWANESWGRYWAWDPKETWALISIIVYAIVLHLRFVPKLNSYFILNTASIFAFWSIVMTSFGVNYFLSGLHSYAAGDPMPIPSFVYIIAISTIILVSVAYLKYRTIYTELET
ncbi:cytochrome c biogenesis protein [Robertkochia solimangrovi]|uniref:cytochrome c biogenesis protein n=1 Tax=Robertkochia solimangrovi TaxID=2213046 RepID=UPI00117DF413|nr:cytochrome c biogenesis protein CcsA [Robertkochia solimangrovi]TRZ42032.1 cytochrome C biogenesis protein [Robertkochia solimangrovi]